MEAEIEESRTCEMQKIYSGIKTISSRYSNVDRTKECGLKNVYIQIEEWIQGLHDRALGWHDGMTH